VTADVKRVADRLTSDSSITAFVNNAGIASASKLLDSNPDYLEQIVQINVTAFTRLAVAAASNISRAYETARLALAPNLFA
jgi:short-subunit dehydrogenase